MYVDFFRIILIYRISTSRFNKIEHHSIIVHRWKRRELIEWPARSPDLNSSNFFERSYLKGSYSTCKYWWYWREDWMWIYQWRNEKWCFKFCSEQNLSLFKEFISNNSYTWWNCDLLVIVCNVSNNLLFFSQILESTQKMKNDFENRDFDLLKLSTLSLHTKMLVIPLDSQEWGLFKSQLRIVIQKTTPNPIYF